MSSHQYWLAANWGVDIPVISGTTLSDSPLAVAGFNLANHVEDSKAHVAENRARLAQATELSGHWLWLNQIHSNHCIEDKNYHGVCDADAVISRAKQAVAVVMTADCLPILISHKSGSEVAAIHAGWKGLYGGIISNTLAKLQHDIGDYYAWLGPCIRQTSYEVDDAFRARFVGKNATYAAAFAANRAGHYLADLPRIAKAELHAAGIPLQQMSDCGIDTFTDARFFSYRRNGKDAGRIATFIAPQE